ncbi:hypothetical protein EDF56_10660 [Novosphingobium sp. PhB165]|uniref:DUF3617 domain-containing protein n=1 Tax=Novosphingobium sp. PhB165 TaxID=2485105 RepID=UPI0010E6170D|nr:hypothetical protein [Novosphingobium sp. PhB165]TCM16948.1 hypothetical protein EDF56_10660 [Novosphingobium sp. PhB165]
MDKTDGPMSEKHAASNLKRVAKAGLIGLACIGLAAVSLPAAAQKKPLAMLDQLERGTWEFRGLRDGARKLCVRNGRDLIQLRHPGEDCHTVVVDDRANEVTVQYTCTGRGFGRTHVRRETNALVQIDSQGIANGQPFAFVTEARRVGDCGG